VNDDIDRGYECFCHVFSDPVDRLCMYCRSFREEWEREQAAEREREQAEDLEDDVHDSRRDRV
jgi:hypothetical protein